jgi:hypothetical protein
MFLSLPEPFALQRERDVAVVDNKVRRGKLGGSRRREMLKAVTAAAVAAVHA